MPGLDGLRALAVIAVVWHHSHLGYAGLPISRNGFLGVDVLLFLVAFSSLFAMVPLGTVNLPALSYRYFYRQILSLKARFH